MPGPRLFAGCPFIGRFVGRGLDPSASVLPKSGSYREMRKALPGCAPRAHLPCKGRLSAASRGSVWRGALTPPHLAGAGRFSRKWRGSRGGMRACRPTSTRQVSNLPRGVGDAAPPTRHTQKSTTMSSVRASKNLTKFRQSYCLLPAFYDIVIPYIHPTSH